jgi:hypothetical protein
MHISPEAVHAAGLAFMKYPVNQRRETVQNKKRFRRHFGVGSSAIAALFNDLPAGSPYHNVFETIHWLKGYDTRENLKPKYDKNETYISRDLLIGLQAINSLYDKKIFIGNVNLNNPFPFSTDGVHASTYERRTDPSAKWYSHKKNGPGVGYAFTLSTEVDRCVHISGWHHPSTHDLTTFRGGNGPIANRDHTALYFRLLAGTKAIADSAYAGEPSKVMVARTGHTPELADFIRRVKARQESYHSRLESFRAFKDVFRHKLDRHLLVVRAIAILVQYDMENGHPLMKI